MVLDSFFECRLQFPDYWYTRFYGGAQGDGDSFVFDSLFAHAGDVWIVVEFVTTSNELFDVFVLKLNAGLFQCFEHTLTVFLCHVQWCRFAFCLCECWWDKGEDNQDESAIFYEC